MSLWMASEAVLAAASAPRVDDERGGARSRGRLEPGFSRVLVEPEAKSELRRSRSHSDEARRLDIGHLLARWTNPGEDPVLQFQAGGTAHYPTRAEMAQRYAERSGRDLSALPYYECLALFKLAVILEGTYARKLKADVPEADNMMGELVPRLTRAAAAFARGERS